MITRMKVPYTYLDQEFNIEVGLGTNPISLILPHGKVGSRIISKIAKEMERGYYTLGPPVQEFEEKFAELCQAKYAIGVGSGTDAIFLILKAIGYSGVGLTTPTTFVATANAMYNAGLEVRFADIGDDFNMVLPEVPEGISHVIQVLWGGNPRTILDLGHFQIIDACQAVGAVWDGRNVGSFGLATAFSLHPLKNLNVMGDGGMVTTNDQGLADDIRLLRNHGLKDRNTCARIGYNSRLDTIQAIVALEGLKELSWITAKRIDNARRYDKGLKGMPQIGIPERDPRAKHVYHLYQIEVGHRDDLLAYLQNLGIEAKVHYPIPLHLQPAYGYLRYKQGDFPRAEAFCANHITLPVHQFLTEEQIDYTIQCIRNFYKVP